MMKKAAKKSPSKKKSAPNAEMAAALRQMVDLMAGGDVVPQGDLDALLTSLHGPSPTAGLSDEEAGARAEAQQIAFDAMEAETEESARKLAKRALRLDPDCVDALVVLGGIESDSPRMMIEALQKAVDAGERSLGAAFIKKNKGHFWALLDTRPYMRALEQLASLLRAEGFNQYAIKNYENMLALNPNDNQGVRDPLLGLYLALGSLDEAAKLLHTYKNDASANFAWGRVLERFLSGDQAAAAAELKKARKANSFVELFLTGKKNLPREMPEMYSPGSEQEAILCLDNMSLAWGNFKPAVLWLMEQLSNDKSPKQPPAAKPKKVPRKA